MTERVTLKPGDYVSTEWLSEDGYHAVADAFMAAGAGKGEYPNNGWMKDKSLLFFGWRSDRGSMYHGAAMRSDPAKGRHLTIDQVLTATNAGGQTQDTLSTILESAAEHDAKAKHHAEEHERLMQQARHMLPDGWMLVRGGIDWAEGQDMSDPANWEVGDYIFAPSGEDRMDMVDNKPYEIVGFDRDRDPIIIDESGRECAHAKARLRFHHRPNT